VTSAVCGLWLWALLLGGSHAKGQGLDGDRGQRQAAPTRVTLTNHRPTGYFPIDPETLASAPPILGVTITRVVNPGKTPFQVFVYLSYQPRTGRTEPEKILIGNFGLYPPDRPSGFLLRSSRAFRKLKSLSSSPTDLRLLLEMKRIHAKSPWTAVEVTIAPPEWRREVRQ